MPGKRGQREIAVDPEPALRCIHRSGGVSESCLVSLLNGWQRLEFLAGCAAWLVAVIYFWNWWLDPTHVNGIAYFVVVTVVLVWITFEPLYFLVMFSGARKPAGALRLPPVKQSGDGRHQGSIGTIQCRCRNARQCWRKTTLMTHGWQMKIRHPKP